MKLKNYKERIDVIPEETRESVREGHRIDEILKEYTGVAPDSGAARPILRAMQQYGAEQYQKGRMDQEKVEYFKLGLQLEEVSRLRKLVQAQKELIKYLEAPESCQDIRNGMALRHKIKELEK